MLCYTILYYTILYYTILYYTILYYTILLYTLILDLCDPRLQCEKAKLRRLWASFCMTCCTESTPSCCQKFARSSPEVRTGAALTKRDDPNSLYLSVVLYLSLSLSLFLSLYIYIYIYIHIYIYIDPNSAFPQSAVTHRTADRNHRNRNHRLSLCEAGDCQ